MMMKTRERERKREKPEKKTLSAKWKFLDLFRLRDIYKYNDFV